MDARKFYEENRARYTKEEQVKARHILIKLDPKASKKAVKVAQAKDKDLAALAKEFSERPSASDGGDLGFFPHARPRKT